MHRPGTELATSRSQVRHHNHIKLQCRPNDDDDDVGLPGEGDVVGRFKDAALTQQPGPQLDADDAEDEEDEEAEKQDVTEHRQRVQ